MSHFHCLAAWLCTTAGLALLMCSVVLVPNEGTLADDGSGGTLFAVCENCIVCLYDPNAPPDQLCVFTPGLPKCVNPAICYCTGNALQMFCLER